MSSRSGCGDLDRLSAYLDGEVDDLERRRLERHLADCPACGERLAGLRRVVASLSRLERSAPPPTLGVELTRRVARLRHPRGPLERLEDRLRAASGGPPLFVAFAVVLALAAILYLVAHGVERGVERGADRGTAIVVLDREASREVAARFADRDPWTRRAEDRLFERRGDRWVEASLAVGSGRGEERVDRRLDPASPAGRALLARLPGLGPLLEDARGVVLTDGGRVVELRSGGD